MKLTQVSYQIIKKQIILFLEFALFDLRFLKLIVVLIINMCEIASFAIRS